MKRARVVGLGQSLAGDDAVGLAVIAHLRRHGGGELELHEAGEPARLCELLLHDAPVVIIDAFICRGAPAGEVRELDVGGLGDEHVGSSHGVGVADAIALVRVVSPGEMAPAIAIVGVAIERACAGVAELSCAVAAAVPRAAATAARLARESRRRGGQEPKESLDTKGASE